MANERITEKQAELWLGTDWQFSTILEIIVDLANGDYDQQQMREDILEAVKPHLLNVDASLMITDTVIPLSNSVEPANFNSLSIPNGLPVVPSLSLIHI